jgi:hypothetical protein
MLGALDQASFTAALSSEDGLLPPILIIGLVKKGNAPDFIEFTADVPGCLQWIRVPVTLIEKVLVLGKRQCRDHFHDLVQIQLKQPDSPEGKVFANLLQQASSTPVQPDLTSSEVTADSACKCGTVISFVSKQPIGRFRVCEPDLPNKLRKELQAWGVPPNGVSISDC